MKQPVKLTAAERDFVESTFVWGVAWNLLNIERKASGLPPLKRIPGRSAGEQYTARATKMLAGVRQRMEALGR